MQEFNINTSQNNDVKVGVCICIKAASPLWSLNVVQILDVQNHLLGLLLGGLGLLLR